MKTNITDSNMTCTHTFTQNTLRLSHRICSLWTYKLLLSQNQSQKDFISKISQYLKTRNKCELFKNTKQDKLIQNQNLFLLIYEPLELAKAKVVGAICEEVSVIRLPFDFLSSDETITEALPHFLICWRSEHCWVFDSK